MRNVFIYGCGGVGSEIASHIINSSEYQLCGFIDDNQSIREWMGFPSRTIKEVMQTTNLDSINTIVSIGEPAVREIISHKIDSYAVNEITINFSSYCDIQHSIVENGCLLHFGSYISVNTKIGRSCLINKNVIVGHDCTIGNYSVLCPNVTLGGNVSIGEKTFIGTGAVVRNGITVGNNVIIGMGAVVVDDVDDNVVVVGNPAKMIRINTTERVF